MAGAEGPDERALQTLRATHTFPGRFAFKAIGANTPAFVAAVLQAAVSVLGPTAQPEVSCRQSAQGRHQAVHLTAEVDGAEQVLAIYTALRSVDGLKVLL